MATPPTPKSHAQIEGVMLQQLAGDTGISRLKIGGPLLSVIEATARVGAKISRDSINAVISRTLDNADEASLIQIGRDEGTPRLEAAKASGRITVGDSSFTKKFTDVSTAGPAPIIGTTSLRVTDASTWPATGSVYIGRRTANSEGPLTYTAITPSGSHHIIALSAPTTRFHNYGEEVTLAQGGNRTIGRGQVVTTPVSTLSSSVGFVTLYDTVLEDGETTVEGVQVLAQLPGASGNVQYNTLTVFQPAPFNGATTTNPKPFVTGRDVETVEDYRERLRATLGNAQGGTDLAIENAVVGLVSPAEDSRIISANLVRTRGVSDTLYIDDGSGYEEIPEGVGQEILFDRAVGGETDVATAQKPISKARVVTTNRAPYILADSWDLTISVGGLATTHVFDGAKFRSIQAASAYEVVASINGDPSLNWSATTTEAGTAVAIFARAETNDDLVVVSGSAIEALQLTSNHVYSTLLYKNDRPLSKDGSDAIILSLPFSRWNNFSGLATLELTIDGTPSITWIFTDQDFIDASTGFSAVGKCSVDAWVKAISAKIPGVTASAEDDRLILRSNRSRTGAARLAITGGTMVTDSMFEISDVYGANSDYTVDRATGQIYLNTPLSAGDRLSLGSSYTRAFIESTVVTPSNLATDAKMWLALDDSADRVTTGLGTSTSLTADVDDVVEHGYKVSITAAGTTEIFANVTPGDHAIFFDPTTMLPDALRKAWRVADVRFVSTLINKIVLEKPCAEVPRTQAASTALLPSGSALSNVFICGGYTVDDDLAIGNVNVGSRNGYGVTATAEVYNATTSTWSRAGTMAFARARHTATTLLDGRVLVVGGIAPDGTALDSSEIWDPATGIWSLGPALTQARHSHTATLLTSGRVLIAGGYPSGASNSSVEYNPGTNAFISAATIPGSHFAHVATRLPATSAQANKVIICGGYSAPSASTTAARLYDPGSATWTSLASMTSGHSNCGIGVLASNHIVVGGDRRGGNTTKYQVYNVSTNTWLTEQTFPGGFKSEGQAWATTPNGTVVIPYGYTGTGSGATTGHYKLVHNGGAPEAPTITALPLSKFRGVFRSAASVVALQGTTVPQRVLISHGTSVANVNRNDLAQGITASCHEAFDVTGNLWLYPDPSLDLLSSTLPAKGLVFVRSPDFLHEVTIPAGAGYSAPTFVAAINAALKGGTASVYRTTRVRINSSSHREGTIMLVASTISGPAPGFPNYLPLSTTAQESETSHLASVRSTNTTIPQNMEVYNLVYSAAADIPTNRGIVTLEDSAEFLSEPPRLASGELVALKRPDSGLNPYYWSSTYLVSTSDRDDDLRTSEWGNSAGGRFAIGSYAEVANNALSTNIHLDSIKLGLREMPSNAFGSRVPVVIDSPLHFSYLDTLGITVNGNPYTIPMSRRCATSGAYGSTLTLTDDILASTLSKNFGISYDFKDFAVLMAARTLTHAGDATKRMLWRWKVPGPNGEAGIIRYTYPAAANTDATVEVIDIQGKTSPTTEAELITKDTTAAPAIGVHIVLNSGDPKDDHILRTTSRLALARTSLSSGMGRNYILCGWKVIQGQRTSAGTTGNRLRLEIPDFATGGPLSTGLTIGSLLWFEAAIPSAATLFSGALVLTQVDAPTSGYQDVYFDGTQLSGGGVYGPTANVGTVSLDIAGETRFDQTLINGDFLRLESDNGLPAQFSNTTMRIAAIGPQYIWAQGLDITTGGPVPTPIFANLLDPTDIKTFSGSTMTPTTLAPIVNALETSPVTATVTGTGNAPLFLASWDEGLAASAGAALTNGLNFVQSTIDPANNTINTQFVLRLPIDTSLISNADWSNEKVYLQPVLASDVVQWLRTPAVSGISSSGIIDYTSSNQIEIASPTPGSAGTLVVTGGSANSATAVVDGSVTLIDRPGAQQRDSILIKTPGAANFEAGHWVRIENANGLPKTPWWDASTIVNSITESGVWTFNIAPYVLLASITDVRVDIAVVGDLVAITIPHQANYNIPTVTIAEHDYIYIGPTVAPTTALPQVGGSNIGIFQVVGSSRNQTQTTIWIRNDIAVPTSAVCDIRHVSSNSPVPGDKWVIGSTRFGGANKSEWTIVDIGSNFADNTLSVDVSVTPAAVVTAPITFSTASTQIQLISTPDVYYKKVLTTYPHADGSTAIQVFSSIGYDRIGEAAGSVVYAAGKLGFDTTPKTGVDGYSYSTGLIAEANRAIYGDETNSAIYKGVAASGASILISGPLVKRTKMGLSLRVQSGAASQALADAARSAAAGVINQSGVGESVAISQIIGAVSEIAGIIAVSITDPLFTSQNDRIEVGASEKALVLDLADISVVFVGD